MPEDRVPKRVYFEMNLAPASATPGNPSTGHGFPRSAPDWGRRSGTGFFISEDGHLITNDHVVEGAKSINVRFEGVEYKAKLLARDRNLDLVVLKIEGKKFVPLAIGDSHSARLGDPVFTLGYPQPTIQGERPKFTEGSISGLSGFQDTEGVFQISVPVQPGNSGGPLVNSRAQVIGIVVSKLKDGQNVNYAVKSRRLRVFLEDVSGINLMKDEMGEARSSPDIAVDLLRSTALIVCE